MEELARRMGAGGPTTETHEATGAAREKTVPWSFRATLLAGLATAFLTAGWTLLQNRAADSVAGLAPYIGKAANMAAPALLGFSLIEAGQATFWTLVFAHSGLKRMGATSFEAYTATSAAVGLIVSLISQVIGLGSSDYGFLTQLVTGASAGFFYRLFAGARNARDFSKR